jgi:hypothetical protein
VHDQERSRDLVEEVLRRAVVLVRRIGRLLITVRNRTAAVSGGGAAHTRTTRASPWIAIADAASS